VPSCTICGEENPERARFCHACGKPFEEESSERFRRTVTAEVLRVSGRPAEAVPIVADALRRYERKEVLPAAARARALLEELTHGVAQEARA
jgi:uncharacterized membrane protein YvbJ